MRCVSFFRGKNPMHESLVGSSAEWRRNFPARRRAQAMFSGILLFPYLMLEWLSHIIFYENARDLASSNRNLCRSIFRPPPMQTVCVGVWACQGERGEKHRPSLKHILSLRGGFPFGHPQSLRVTGTIVGCSRAMGL